MADLALPVPGPGSHREHEPAHHTQSNSVADNHHKRDRRNSSARQSHISHDHPDPNFDLSLPYRTLTEDANLAEYTTENPTGTIPGPPLSSTATEPDDPRYKLVTFQPDDPDNPRNWSRLYRWYCTMVVAITCFVVAFCSSVITPGVSGVADEFEVSTVAALVSVSVFVIGFGVGMSIGFSSYYIMIVVATIHSPLFIPSSRFFSLH